MFLQGMFLPWVCRLLPLLLFPVIQAGCSRGSAKWCENAKFIPGHNLGGEGFDIITLKRKGAYVIDMESFLYSNGTCTLCENSLRKHKYQKLPLNILDWRVDFSYSQEVSSTIYESSLAFANAISSHIENDWRVGLAMPFLGTSVGVVTSGTHSKLSEFAMYLSSRDKYSFSSQEVFCRHYRYRISDFPTLTATFSAQLNLLPNTYNATTQHEFRNLIDIYGTHYIRQVVLGGRIREVTALKTCEVSLDKLTTDQVKDCLGVEASLSIGEQPSSAQRSRCQALQQQHLGWQTFSQKYSDRRSEFVGGNLESSVDLLFPSANQVSPYKRWMKSLTKMPDVNSYALAPLHNLVPSEDPRRELLRQATVDYIMERSIQKRCGSCLSGAWLSQHGTCNCVCHSSSVLTSNCCPRERGLAKMYVVVERAYELDGDIWPNPADGYVIVSYDSRVYRTHYITDNNNPVWNDRFSFGTVKLWPHRMLRIEVWDSDNWEDDLLGVCNRPSTATSGERSELCHFKYGRLWFSYRIECEPHLSGPYCMQYQPSVN